MGRENSYQVRFLSNQLILTNLFFSTVSDSDSDSDSESESEKKKPSTKSLFCHRVLRW